MLSWTTIKHIASVIGRKQCVQSSSLHVDKLIHHIHGIFSLVQLCRGGPIQFSTQQCATCAVLSNAECSVEGLDGVDIYG
jgi:hypothetical protein